jgi:hypothetical protein
MDELLSVLQETQHPLNEIRKRAENYLQEAMMNDGKGYNNNKQQQQQQQQQQQ